MLTFDISSCALVSDIAVFVLKRDVKLQLTHSLELRTKNSDICNSVKQSVVVSEVFRDYTLCSVSLLVRIINFNIIKQNWNQFLLVVKATADNAHNLNRCDLMNNSELS